MGTSKLTYLRKGTAVGVLIVCCFLAFWFGKVIPKGSGSGEGLLVRAEALDFGEVWERDVFQWTLPIENLSNDDVTVEGFETTCSCVSVEPRTAVIPFRGAVEARLTLDLTPRSSEEGALPVRDFTVEVVPRIRDSKVPGRVRWAVSGRVRSAFSLASRTLAFWDNLVQGKPYPSKLVLVTGHSPLEDITTKYDPSLISVEVTRTANATAAFELEVTPRDSLPVGPFATEVSVEAKGRGSTFLHCKKLKVEGIVQGDIQAFPSHVAFGARAVGDKGEEMVSIRSINGERVELEGIEVISDDLTVSPVPGLSADGQTLRVTQQFSRYGPQSTRLKVKVRRDGGGVQVVTLEVTYYGLSR